jgi:hypothetical protein
MIHSAVVFRFYIINYVNNAHHYTWVRERMNTGGWGFKPAACFYILSPLHTIPLSTAQVHFPALKRSF